VEGSLNKLQPYGFQIELRKGVLVAE